MNNMQLGILGILDVLYVVIAVLYIPFIFLYTMFQSSTGSFLYGIYLKRTFGLSKRELKKIKKYNLDDHETYKKIREELISETGLKNTFKEHLHYNWKSLLYLILAYLTLYQLGQNIFSTSADKLVINVALFTLTIAVVEFKDNYKISKETKHIVKEKEEYMKEQVLILNSMMAK